MRRLAFLSLALANSAWALNQDALDEARHIAKETQQHADHAHGACKRSVSKATGDLVKALKRLGDDSDGEDIRKVRRKAAHVQDVLDDCPEEMAREVDHAMDRVIDKLKALRDDDDDSESDEDRPHHRRHFDGDDGAQHADAPPPPPGPPALPPPPGQMMDCGTGPDPDCRELRNGAPAMDVQTFRGLVQSLAQNGNEIQRKQLAIQAFGMSNLTTGQLGRIMDFFPNEIFKLEVGKAAIPHLVAPPHALGLAAKFRNGTFATQFSQAVQQGG